MCGILTCISKKGGLGVKTAGALSLLNHRGPDSRNMFLWGRKGGALTLKGEHALAQASEADFRRFDIAMGHARLSIIDLSDASAQPMVSEDGSFVLSFNGEIYNYLELRGELEARGTVFRTKSDSEVLLKSVETGGIGKLKEMNGMWAFTLLDLKGQKLLLARDRYGKKPLFYYNGGDYFIAASEIKSIFHILGSRRSLDANFLSAFIAFNYWPSFDDGGTIYRDIKALNPGCVLSYGIENGKIEITAENSISDFTEGLTQQANSLSEDIGSAVQIRLRADVPVGVLVSGGVDSSTIAAHASCCASGSEISWYAGNTGDGNDTKYAEMLAKAFGKKLQKIDIRLDIGTKLAERLTYCYEMPLQFLGNSIAMFQIYQKMAADGIRVALDGTGGDEVFGGYFDHYNTGILNSFIQAKDARGFVEFISSSLRFRNIAPGKMLKDLVCGLVLPRVAREAKCKKKYARLGRGFFSYAPENAPLGCISRQHNLIQMQRHDIARGRLPNWLYMNDQNSMINSVEVRSPFLDYRLARYINLPLASKFSNGFNKMELRKAIPGNVVPDAVRWRRDKQGFRWSPSDFINANLPEIRDVILSSEILSSLFEKDRLAARFAFVSRNDCGLLLRLYAVALLQKLFNCSISFDHCKTSKMENA